MIPTLYGITLLLLAAPIIALATWVPAMETIAWLYLLSVLSILALDWHLAGNIDRFQISRQHETRLSLGTDNPIQLNIYNRHRLPTQFWIRDEPPDAFQIQTRILHDQIAARAQWHGIYHVRPLQRGDYTFGNINMRWVGPLKLTIRQAQIQATEPVKVYPNLLNIRRYDLLLRQNRLPEMGLRHTRIFGEGTEFERLRDYLPDDDFRRIEWKATARHNRPVTIEYQTERSQNVFAVLDIGRMMQSPINQIAKLDYAINAVLLLAYVATGKGDKIGLMTFADQVAAFLTPRQGRGQFYRMLESLYAVKAQPVEPDYRRAFNYLALKQRRRALVLIFTDLSGGLSIQSLLNSITTLAQRSLPLVVTISDPDIHAAARQIPSTSQAVYERAAAIQLLDARKIMLDRLRHQGILTLDVPADQLSTAVINRYLELKGRILL